MVCQATSDICTPSFKEAHFRSLNNLFRCDDAGILSAIAIALGPGRAARDARPRFFELRFARGAGAARAKR